MELVFVALPVALLVAVAAVAAFIWAARTDQFEDLDTPPQRAIFDDLPTRNGTNPGSSGGSGTAPDAPEARSGRAGPWTRR